MVVELITTWTVRGNGGGGNVAIGTGIGFDTDTKQVVPFGETRQQTILELPPPNFNRQAGDEIWFECAPDFTQTTWIFNGKDDTTTTTTPNSGLCGYIPPAPPNPFTCDLVLDARALGDTLVATTSGAHGKVTYSLDGGITRQAGGTFGPLAPGAYVVSAYDDGPPGLPPQPDGVRQGRRAHRPARGRRAAGHRLFAQPAGLQGHRHATRPGPAAGAVGRSQPRGRRLPAPGAAPAPHRCRRPGRAPAPGPAARPAEPGAPQRRPARGPDAPHLRYPALLRRRGRGAGRYRLARPLRAAAAQHRAARGPALGAGARQYLLHPPTRRLSYLAARHQRPAGGGGPRGPTQPPGCQHHAPGAGRGALLSARRYGGFSPPCPTS